MQYLSVFSLKPNQTHTYTVFFFNLFFFWFLLFLLLAFFEQPTEFEILYPI